MRKLSRAERCVLAIAQADLPDTLSPYADIGAKCGLCEDEVIALLNEFKASGAIRRFGASIRHQRAGWNHNAMVAWVATPEQADRCARQLAGNANVSHAYYRPTSATDWPYTFYTMTHGRSEEECQAVIERLARDWQIDQYAVLRSLRELKKTSMTYFGAD